MPTFFLSYVANYFFIFLESSETHFDLVASKVGAGLNFSSKVFIEKSEKLKMRVLLNEKMLKNWKIVLLKFQNIVHLWDQKLNLATCEGGRKWVLNIVL